MENKNQDVDSIRISKNKYQLIKSILSNIHENLGKVVDLLEQGPEELGNFDEVINGVSQDLKSVSDDLALVGDERVVEGVFDGQSMISSDGQVFTVPTNYASKSKMIEGDILKLTITKKGEFMYKQIGPVARIRVMGTLILDKDGEYYVIADKKKWKILAASVTYFKAMPNDEVIILVPKEADSKWAAVENIVKK